MAYESIDVVSAGILVFDIVNQPVDRLPDAGELLEVEQIKASVGGCAGNVAINLAKQNIATLLMGKVGNDPQGSFVRDALEQQGVDTSAVSQSSVHATSQTMIVLVKGEDRRFLHCFGANNDFRVADIDRDRARRAKLFYLGGYLVMPSLDPAEVADLLADLRAHGVTVVLDVVIPSDADNVSDLACVLPHVDLFTPNEKEAAIITGLDDAAAQARDLVARGVQTAVVTCGFNGVVVCNRSRLLRADAYPTESIDPSGGGDAFAAGYITGMVKGWPMERVVAYASALGASCIAAVGCHEGTLTAAQADAFVGQHPLSIQCTDRP